MTRDEILHRLDADPTLSWDVIIIGGGASGLGCAVDAATRGYRTLLIERFDFAKGTSGKSTKLVHGGVRYLAQGDVKLVREALHERGLMMKNAPHLVKNLSFVIPAYRWWEKIYYTIGLKIYDLLAGRLSFGRSVMLSQKSVSGKLPTVKKHRLRGGILYHDGQFDDSRMAMALMLTASGNGATLLNYCGLTGFIKNGNGEIEGITAEDIPGKRTLQFRSRVVINATGVFTDDILKMDDAAAKQSIRPSQGIHLVVDKKFLPGTDALMIPATSDGRVLFAVPWHDKVVIGTTDTPVETHSEEPRALESEIRFILDTAAGYLDPAPVRADVLAVFAGLRPLAFTEKNKNTTKEISRSHKVTRSSSGLITILGGKWTTYRKMAEDTIDAAIHGGKLEPRACRTASTPLHGHTLTADPGDHLSVYGTDAEKIRAMIVAEPALGTKLHASLPYLKAEVVWAIRHEMAVTPEDVLSRRTRALLLDAKAAMECAPSVAALMAKELGKDDAWIEKMIREFRGTAEGYCL